MEDLQRQLNRLLTEAEDFAIMATLATDPKKRKMLERLAKDIRGLAAEIEFIIPAREAVGS